MKKATLLLMLLILFGLSTSAFMVGSVRADSVTVYIRANGAVDPDTAPILNAGGSEYTFTADINGSLVIERDNIIVYGGSFSLYGSGTVGSVGLNVTARSNVIVNDLNIESFGHAVHLSNSKGCSLLDNRLADNIFSIWIEDSQDNRIAGNTINRTSRDGISLYRSSGNVVSNNSLRLTGGFGMISMYGFNNTIADNRIRDSTGEDGIQLSNTSNNHVVNNNVDTTFFYGIELASASHNVVSANSVRNGTQGVAGIHLYNSTDNILQGNNITDNGVGFEFSFHSNTNIITENTIENNSIFGMTFSFSSGNVLFHNNFLNNTQQVSTQGVSNTWDNGYPSGGNYWSDYNGSDTYGGTGQNISGSDGIGDTPYVIFGGVQDHYPLMTLFVVPEFSFSALILTLVLTTLSTGIALRKKIHAISRCSG